MFIKAIYFCLECKKIVPDLESLLFIDESSQKGFCCEACIEDFYRPIVKYFADEDLKIRERLNLDSDFDEHLRAEGDLSSITDSAQEVYLTINELGDRFYTFIKKEINFYSIVTASMYQREISFYFFNTNTTSLEHVSEYRKGELVENFLKRNDFKGKVAAIVTEEEELLPIIEHKKSALLADLLTLRIGNDIDFERFNEFEDCFAETVSVPDEVYEHKDKEGDLIVNFIRSFSARPGVSGDLFYYVVSFVRLKNEENFELFPILGFPTVDFNFLARFRVGTTVSGPTKN